MMSQERCEMMPRSVVREQSMIGHRSALFLAVVFLALASCKREDSRAMRDLEGSGAGAETMSNEVSRQADEAAVRNEKCGSLASHPPMVDDTGVTDAEIRSALLGERACPLDYVEALAECARAFYRSGAVCVGESG
jgi:hypothetical protein